MDVDADSVESLARNIEILNLSDRYRAQRGWHQPHQFDNGHHFGWPFMKVPAVARSAMLMSLFSSQVLLLDRDTSDAILKLFTYLVETAMRRSEPETAIREVASSIPVNSSMIRSTHRLDGGFAVYAVCPRCRMLYKPKPVISSTIATEISEYPVKCSGPGRFFGRTCNEPLLDGTNKPLKTFVFNSVLEFIGALLSQASVEASVDRACDDLLHSLQTHSEDIRGPLQAEFLTSFRSHEPERLFVDRGSEVRLFFALCIRAFDAQDNRASHAGAAIVLACLNLPEHVRYEHQNMHLVGFLPKDAKYADTGHYLAPLVDEFLILWNVGVHFSRTASSITGRTVRAAIAYAVCDHPQTDCDFVCSYCARRLERESSKGGAERGQSEKDRGPWSELSRLPYWDPSKQLVVNVTQCLMPGLVQHHLENILLAQGKSTFRPTLSADVVQHLQYVLSETIVPDWVCPASRDFHSVVAGKTWKEEWRTLSTIYLPLALILLHFGDGIQEDAAGVRFKAVMDLAMELVQAVTVLSRDLFSGPGRSTASWNQLIDAYERHLDAYMHDLPSLFPESVPGIKGRLSTHITEFLRRFGPIYSWSSIPFNRAIDSLSIIPRALEIGEPEFTVLTSFSAISRLKRWLAREDCPPCIRECLEVFSRAYAGACSPSPRQPGSDEYIKPLYHYSPKDLEVVDESFIRGNKDKLLDSCEWQGAEYSIRSRHIGNSQIIYRPDGVDMMVPGIIELIIDGDRPKFVVGRLVPPAFNDDHFSHYESVTVAIFHSDVSEREVIDVGKVQGHFAALPLMGGISIILPLCRVS